MLGAVSTATVAVLPQEPGISEVIDYIDVLSVDVIHWADNPGSFQASDYDKTNEAKKRNGAFLRCP